MQRKFTVVTNKDLEVVKVGEEDVSNTISWRAGSAVATREEQPIE